MDSVLSHSIFLVHHSISFLVLFLFLLLAKLLLFLFRKDRIFSKLHFLSFLSEGKNAFCFFFCNFALFKAGCVQQSGFQPATIYSGVFNLVK